VPTPARLPSNEPAIEGPSITKAKATMKLVVRIRLSPGWLPFLLLHNPRPFPEFCTRRENGFVAPENCFVVAAPTKQSGKKFNNFNQSRYSKNVWNREATTSKPWFTGPFKVVQWLTAAHRFGFPRRESSRNARFSGGKALREFGCGEPKHWCDRLNRAACNFSGQFAL